MLKPLSLLLLTLPAAAPAAGSVFPESYEQSRSIFRSLVGANPAFRGTKISVPSRGQEDLTIDAAYAPAKGARRKLVVVSSGVHGVESPAGSVVLQELLQGCLPGLDRSGLGIVLVHAVNPYGFKHGRRFNESNVDLNRNCFDHEKQFPGPTIANAAYEKLKDVYHRDSLIGRPGLVYGMAKHLAGEGTVTASLAGQYRYPEGIYYGGRRVEPECAKVQRYLDAVAREGYAEILHLDVHTGLGPSGLSQIMVNGPQLAAFRALFPSPSKGTYVVQASDGSGGTIGNHGDFTRFLCDRRPGTPCLAATLEIGASGGLATLAAIINENVVFQHPALFPEADRRQAREALRSTFIPRDESWRKKVRDIAGPVCQAIKTFGR